MSKIEADALASAKLKPVENKKDASAPAIDPNLKTDVTKGKQTKEQLKEEIKKGKQLKQVKTRDASAPMVDNVPLNLPDRAKVEELIKSLWSKDNRRAWIVMHYTGPDTVSYQAHGNGSVSEAVALLEDNKVQYCLFRIPVDTQTGEINVQKVRDVFVAWTGPKVGVIEKGKKKVHIGRMGAFLKPSHAELQAVNRDLLTEQNLLYCSDPHGAHIIEYEPSSDPNARKALKSELLGGAKLKKTESVKDASAPVLDPHLKVNTKDTTSEQLAKEIEGGAHLKPVAQKHDASAPSIDPHLKLDVNAGKQRKEKFKQEISSGTQLKKAETVHDASAPAVPEPIKCPDAAAVRALIQKNFNSSAQRAWVLLGYQGKDTIVLEGSGTGPVSEVVAKLQDDKVQYFLVRFPMGDTAGEVHASTTRDVMVVWAGPKVGVIEKAKKKTHLGGITLLLSPHNANLTAVQKEFLTEQNLVFCSDPHAGTHAIEWQANTDPKAVGALKLEIKQGTHLKPVAKQQP